MEDATVPKRKPAKRSAADEDASMASDDVGTKQPKSDEKRAMKPQRLASECGDSAPESGEESIAPERHYENTLTRRRYSRFDKRHR